MANLKARVELRGCLTHSARGRTCKRGQPFYTTNAADIAYYKAQGEYSVTMLAAPPAPKAKAAKPKPPPPPPPDDDDDDDDEEDGEEGEEPEGEDEEPASHTKSDLERMNKEALAELAETSFSLDLDPDKLSKPKMVAAILKAQIAALSG